MLQCVNDFGIFTAQEETDLAKNRTVDPEELDEDSDERVNFFMPVRLRRRVQNVTVATHRSSEADTLRMLVLRGLEWWESLHEAEQKAS